MRSKKRGRISSLDWLATAVFDEAQDFMAFWAASAHC